MPLIVIPFSPIAFQIGPLQIHWYGIAYAVAFVVAGAVAVRHAVAHGIPSRDAEAILTWCIPIGLVGGRLYFVVQSDFGWYLTHPEHILAIWEGGMAFFGAIFASLAVIIVAARRLHLSLWVMLDAGALFAAVGQPIGRIGNIANGEILGPPSDLPWAIAYTDPRTMAPKLGVGYQPAAAYEAVAVLLILGLLLWLRRRGVPTGMLAIVYLALYPISQIVVFIWRTGIETPVIWLGLRQAQLTSVAFLLFLFPPIAYFWWRSRRPANSLA